MEIIMGVNSQKSLEMIEKAERLLDLAITDLGLHQAPCLYQMDDLEQGKALLRNSVFSSVTQG